MSAVVCGSSAAVTRRLSLIRTAPPERICIVPTHRHLTNASDSAAVDLRVTPPLRALATEVAINAPAPPVVTHADTDETELVKRAKRGDRYAFGVLYDVHVDAIYRYVAFRVREDAEAEDVTSDVFVKALLGLPRYEPRQPFLAWLYRIARNTVVDRARRNARRSQADLTDAVAEEGSDGDPVAHAAAAERRRHLRRALATLSRDQQDVIVLHFIARLTASEIGDILGKPASTVRGIQMRALNALRKRLDPDVLG